MPSGVLTRQVRSWAPSTAVTHMAETFSQVKEVWLRNNTLTVHKTADQDTGCARHRLHQSCKAYEAKLAGEAIQCRLMKLDKAAAIVTSEAIAAADDWAQNCKDTARSYIYEDYIADLLALQERLKALELRLKGSALFERLILVTKHAGAAVKDLAATCRALVQSQAEPDLMAVWTKLRHTETTVYDAIEDRRTALQQAYLDAHAAQVSAQAADDGDADAAAHMRTLPIGEYVRQGFPPAVMTPPPCVASGRPTSSSCGCDAHTVVHNESSMYQYAPQCVKEWKYLDPHNPNGLELKHALGAFQDNTAHILQQAGSHVTKGRMDAESRLTLDHQPNVELNLLQPLQELTRFLHGTIVSDTSKKLEWIRHSPHLLLRVRRTLRSRVQTVSSHAAPAPATAASIRAVGCQGGMEGGSRSAAAGQVHTAAGRPLSTATEAWQAQTRRAATAGAAREGYLAQCQQARVSGVAEPSQLLQSGSSSIPVASAAGCALGQVSASAALSSASAQLGHSAHGNVLSTPTPLTDGMAPPTARPSTHTRKRQRAFSKRIYRARKRWGLQQGTCSNSECGHPIRCFIQVTEVSDVSVPVLRSDTHTGIQNARPIDLVAAYHNKNTQHPDVKKARDVCTKAMTCMLQWNVQYAVVTCYWFTWLLHVPAQHRHERVLYIYGPVLACTAAPGITGHTALLFSMCRALEQVHNHEDDPAPGGAGDVHEDASSAECLDKTQGKMLQMQTLTQTKNHLTLTAAQQDM